MRGADPVNDEFEVGFNQTFEQRWFRAERIGRFIMVAFVAAGFVGLFGRGPFSHRTKSMPDSGLTVDFEPIAQSQTGTQVTFHVANAASTPTMELLIGSRLVEPMGLQRILPQPVRTQAVQDGLLLTVAVPPGTGDAAIRLMLMPVGSGPKHLTARLTGHAPLHWTQLVVP